MNTPAPVTELQIDRREFLAHSAAAKLSWERTIAHFKKHLA